MMTIGTDSRTGRADLAAAARRYADYLRAEIPAGGGSRPDGPHLGDLVPSDGSSTWAWARFLAAYDDWRPHRVALRFGHARFDRLVRGSRALLDTQARPPRRRGLFVAARPGEGIPADGRLAEVAAALDELERTAASDGAEKLDRLAALSWDVDAAATRLGPGDSAVRLGRVGRPLGSNWPPAPPALSEESAEEFLPLLLVLLQAGCDRDPPIGSELFEALAAEHLRQHLAPQMLPSGVTEDALRAIVEGQPGDLPAMLTAYYAARGDSPSFSWLVARLAHQYVRSRVPDITPPLDPVTLTVPEGYRPPADCDLVYTVSDLAPRQVVEVGRFAVSPARPCVRFSLGPKPPRAWALLLAPKELYGVPPGRGRELLDVARKRAGSVFWSGHGDSREDPEWQAWLTGPEAPGWLAGLASSPDPTSASWMTAVRDWVGPDLWPPVGSDGRPTWPVDVPRIQVGTRFREDPAPAGAIIAVERFGVRPEGARMVLSSGPSGTQYLAKAAATLWESVCECDGLRPLPQASLVRLVESAVTDGALSESAPYGEVLDGLAGLEPGVVPTAAAASVLRCLRELAAAVDLSIHPLSWDFGPGGPLPANAEPGLAVRPVFRAREPVGTMVRVRSFALARHGEILRTGEVVVSAGPAPERVGDLDRLAESLTGSGAEEFRAGLRELRAAGLGGYLEEAAVRLYYHYWEHVRPWHATSAPGDQAAVTDALGELLAKTFGLSEFRPSGYREYPEGWIRVPPGTRVRSGTVTRLIAPGLVTSDGELRAPAFAEVD